MPGSASQPWSASETATTAAPSAEELGGGEGGAHQAGAETPVGDPVADAGEEERRAALVAWRPG